jgi:hypothetical protein
MFNRQNAFVVGAGRALRPDYLRANSLPPRPPFDQNARPLPDSQPGEWSLLSICRGDVARFIQVVAREQQSLDTPAITAPQLRLVEIARVRDQRVVGFLSENVAIFRHGNLCLCVLSPRRARGFDGRVRFADQL